MSVTNELLSSTPVNCNGVRNHFTLSSGLRISIQASRFHYCSPRDYEGPYESVEIGFPSEHIGEEFEEYAEDKGDQTSTVFAFVPVNLIDELIKRHGGIS